jgi:MoaA/NifB/PqqE/SkfB family radical SAM enzyme
MDGQKSFVQGLLKELPSEVDGLRPKDLSSSIARPTGELRERARLPEVIYLELADYCNLNCMFCGRDSEVRRTGDHGGYADLAKLKMLERPLRSAKYLGLSGRIGEPLLYPKLGEFLRWVYDINPEIQLRITTNGTSLTRKMAAQFVGHLDFVGISLNASNGNAYVRDMRPAGSQRGADWSGNWKNLIRRIAEFLEALPPADRQKVFIIAPAHRDNLDDIPDFVRLVAEVGCSRAVITPMQVHDESKTDLSVFWIKDKYNDVMDEASVLGTQLGIRVDAARFYSTVKTKFDLEAVCRDPLDVAYLNMDKLKVAAPCCHWMEDAIPCDVYGDPDGFERFWNHEILQRLREKRDTKSCRGCGLGRAFDEVMFHFTPLLKAKLAEAGKLANAEAHSDYPDHELVRACHAIGLNLPSLRRSVQSVGVSTQHLEAIRTEGASVLPTLDRLCWDAFQKSDGGQERTDLSLAGSFAGIGWGDAQYDFARRRSMRWLATGRVGSVFLKVKPGSAYEIQLSAHGVQPIERVRGVQLSVCEQPVGADVEFKASDHAVITIEVSSALTRAFDGRLWLKVIWLASPGSDGPIAFSRVELTKLSRYEVLMRQSDRKVAHVRASVRQYKSFVISRIQQALTSTCTLVPQATLKARQQRSELKRYFEVIRADPIGSIPRIRRRLARILRVR